MSNDIQVYSSLSDFSSFTHEEWLNKLSEAKIYRDGAIYLNASEISSWIGKSKYVSPSEVLFNKLIGKKTEANDYMIMGKQLEDFIISKVMEICGLSPYKREEWQVYRTAYIGTLSNGVEVYIGGRPDAMGFSIFTAGDELYESTFVIEVKYMVSYKTSDFDYIPDWYLEQVYSYSIIFNMPVIFGAFMSDGFFVKSFNPAEHADKIEEFKKSVLNVAENLYNKNIDFFDTSNRNFVKKKVTGKTDKGQIIIEYINFLEQHKKLVEDFNAFVKKRDIYLNKIKNLFQQGEYYYGGKKIVIREVTRKDFNQEKFREDNPDLYELYSTEKLIKYVFYDEYKGESLFHDEEL